MAVNGKSNLSLIVSCLFLSKSSSTLQLVSFPLKCEEIGLKNLCSHIFCLFKKKRFYFQGIFRFTATLSETNRDFPLTCCPPSPRPRHTQPRPLLTSNTKVVHLWKTMNLHWHVIIQNHSLHSIGITHSSV